MAENPEPAYIAWQSGSPSFRWTKDHIRQSFAVAYTLCGREIPTPTQCHQTRSPGDPADLCLMCERLFAMEY